MRYSSLGLIETEGLVGTIEAADAAAKAANVELMSCEYATGGLVTIVFTGGLGDVQAAVEAGAAAAARVGQLVAQRVIAAPHEDLRALLGIIPPGRPAGENDGTPGVAPTPEGGPEGTLPAADSSPVPAGRGTPAAPARTAPGLRQRGTSGEVQIEEMRVSALRHYARSIPGIELHGREISRATKEQLIRLIKGARQKSSP